MAEKNKRFERSYSQNSFTSTVEIWVDKETGVNYLCVVEGGGTGLTPLLDKDGKPVVTLAEFK